VGRFLDGTLTYAFKPNCFTYFAISNPDMARITPLFSHTCKQSEVNSPVVIKNPLTIVLSVVIAPIKSRAWPTPTLLLYRLH
jgi:hypothetical protein